MIEKIAIFYLFAFSIYYLVNIFWRNKLSQFALTWFGPIPYEGELLSQFKFRRFWYALNWLFQFIYALLLLYVVGIVFPKAEQCSAFLVIMFGLTIGFGMSTLASIGFLLSYAKTKVFGPDALFNVENEVDFENEILQNA